MARHQQSKAMETYVGAPYKIEIIISQHTV